MRLLNLATLPGRAFNGARIALMRKAAAHYGISPVALFRRGCHLYFRHGLGFNEALISGLLDPKVSDDLLRGCVSRDALFRHQERHNPRDWTCLTEDKAAFYAYCKGLGLPTTAPIAVFDRAGGWSADGTLLHERREWEQFFDDRLPEEFIIKPSRGAWGVGFTIYRRQPDGFLDSSGQVLTASQLHDRLCNDVQFRRFVIQDRLRAHPDIVRLSGTDALQTIRIVTWLLDDRVRFLAAHMKIITGSNLHDNYHSGRTGNLHAKVDIERGVLAASTSASEIGLRTLAVHPTTGVAIDGFSLPDWPAARELACRAARLFYPLRTVGWDIALTSEGPNLLEGNAFWDPANNTVVGPQASEDQRREMIDLMERFKTK